VWKHRKPDFSVIKAIVSGPPINRVGIRRADALDSPPPPLKHYEVYHVSGHSLAISRIDLLILFHQPFAFNP
jgi:hypothetical protein